MAIGPVSSTTTTNLEDLGGFGCNYDEDITSLTESESPNSIDMEFDQTVVRKRPGYRSITTSIGAADVGYNIFNFADDDNVQKQVSHQGNTVYSMDNLEAPQTSIRSGVPRVQSFFSEVNRFLIHTFDDYSNEYYWDGDLVIMAILSADAPGFKHVTEAAGFLLGGNIDGEPLRIYYEDTNSMIGGTYTEFFTLSGGRDDEITGFFEHNGRTYAHTSSAVFLLSFVGGVTVWDFKKVIDTTGIVPRTAVTVATDDFSEIVLFLGFDLNLYMFDGTKIQIISDKYRKPNNDTPISLGRVDRGKIKKSHAVYDVIARVYRLFVTAKGDDANEFCLNIDVRNLSYYPYQNMKFASATIAQDGIGRLFLVGVDYVGKIHKMFIDVNDDDGIVIVENYESPPMVQAAERYKKAQTMALHFTPVANYKLFYDDRTDYDKTWNERTTLSMVNSRDRILGENFVLGETAVLGSDTAVLDPRVNIPVTYNVYRFRLGTKGTAGAVCRYLTGTIAGVGGGTSLTGTSTVWTSDMTAANGWKIWIDDGEHKNFLYDFTYVSSTSATVSTMTGASPADDFTGASYELFITGEASCQKRWELMKIDFTLRPLTVGKGTKIR